MRNCESVRDDLKSYIDGQLSPVRRLTARMHVSRCTSCREEMREMEQIGKDLRAGDIVAFDPALKARILAGMPSGAPDAAPARRRRLLPESKQQRMYLYGGLAA